MRYSVDEIASEIEVPGRVLCRFLADEGISVKRGTSYSEAEFGRIRRLWVETGASACFEEHGRLIRSQSG